MAEKKLNKARALILVFLVVAIVVGGIIIGAKYNREAPVEISLPQRQEPYGEIYVGGAVNSPGFFTLQAGDTIRSLIQAAGGTSASADSSGLELYVTGAGDEPEGQKIDINRADVWLLEALPGIGETLARRIVDYRRQHGQFNSTNELLKVPGIGTATYENIRDLITVADR
jgi:competence protein ComEA